uniref:Uncharacterized protein n=1 Tax=Rhizophora mucronata TaxID=61149 RepID=A0A2P2PJH7_RHIMU
MVLSISSINRTCWFVYANRSPRPFPCKIFSVNKLLVKIIN